MKLITLNIWGGHVREPLLQFIKRHADTDIFCLQEVYHNAKNKITKEDRKVYLEIFAEISALLPHHKGYFRPVVAEAYGIGVLIKKSIEILGEGDVDIYENPDYPGYGPAHSRKLQWLECRSNNQDYCVLNVHGLWNGKGKTDCPERLMQSQKIKDFLDTISLPKIMCGDFNLRPDTLSLKALETNMKNLISLYNIQSTRTSYYPKDEKYADYIITSPEVTVNKFEVLTDEVSDHSPLLLDFGGRMTPLDYYREQCRKDFVLEDAEQLNALTHLQQVYFDLLKEYQRRRQWYAFLRKPKRVMGVYLWGGVGIGKTFVMDCFYHCLPFKKKKRIHFHQFMQWAHEELKKYQGEANPLDKIAKELSKKTMVLCFDELHVSDIADAMILARFFTALTTYGVSMVITSNVSPDDLYLKGLQRPLFLPAIDLLKQVTTVIAMPTVMDYRLRHLFHSGAFYTPIDEIADVNMEKSFTLLSEGKLNNTTEIIVCDRPIQVVKEADNIVWFDFYSICTVPRSSQDYLAIAKKYKSVFISNIPSISASERNTIRLFVRMIDVFYDARVRLICSSENEVTGIYTEGDMLFEYARTRSRLLEMQSESYFVMT